MLGFFIDYGPMIYIMVVLFIAGAVVGSFLNVWIARLPLEKSIFWPPGSRCGNCYRAIRFRDNLPLVSYWLLGGRCRFCKAPFSARYFIVELFVAVAFVLIFYVEIWVNVHDIPAFHGFKQNLRFNLLDGRNWPAFVFWLQHAVLVCFLVAAALCDLEDRSIPLSITVTGTFIGLMFATLLPWPWPYADVQAALPHPRIPVDEWWELAPGDMQKLGLYPWPVWGPLPAWLRPGSWKLGLVTGLAGALAGTFSLRGVKFLFEKGFGREALGLGDADLMMMVGAFLGWQPTLIAFLVGAVVSLVFTAPFVMLRGKSALPFGPGLAAGAVITSLLWDSIGPVLQVLLFNYRLMLLLVGACSVVTFLLAFLMGRVQGPAPSTPGKPP
jgi:leader peptidase (prepilin peptidase)/N-methyltransferase